MKGKVEITESFLSNEIRLQRVVLIRQMVRMVVSANFRNGTAYIADKVVEAIKPFVANCEVRAHDDEQYDICIQPSNDEVYYVVISLRDEEVTSYMEIGASNGERYFLSMFYEMISTIYDEDGMNGVSLPKDIVLKVLSADV